MADKSSAKITVEEIKNLSTAFYNLKLRNSEAFEVLESKIGKIEYLLEQILSNCDHTKSLIRCLLHDGNWDDTDTGVKSIQTHAAAETTPPNN